MIKFASVFSDYAVLQRRMPIPVWGTAEPRRLVEVRFRGESRRVLSTPDGRFLVRFSPCEAGGPFVLEAELHRGRGRTLKSNGVRLKSAAELSGIFQSVLFCPEDLTLIRAGAAERRRILHQ